MKNTSLFPLSAHRLESPAIRAKRLLEELDSPLLQLASQIPLTRNPTSRLSASPEQRLVAAEVEKVSRGRFSLARDQQQNGNEWSRYTRLKIVHHACQRYSWVSMALLEALGGTEKCCCYCSEPLSLGHIGRTTDLTSIQRFVEIRSAGKVRFSDLNCLEDVNLDDIFLFECLSPCRGLVYDIPFLWFLRYSKPGNSPEDTCGCPCCTANQTQK